MTASEQAGMFAVVAFVIWLGTICGALWLALFADMAVAGLVVLLSGWAVGYVPFSLAAWLSQPFRW